MMCPPPSDDRTGRTYSNFGANTLWFQYILCQQESIPSLACWLFTSGWNQAEFGQYYLYDNLLNSEEGGLLDGDLLPILALGGLGGGSYAPAHGGHPVYRREVICEHDEEKTAEGCRKRRSATTEGCKDGESPAECRNRKRRSPTNVGCKDGETAAECSNRKRRSPTTVGCKDGETHAECSDRKRRTAIDECEDGETHAECSERKRRTAIDDCEDDETPAECRKRKRRSATIEGCKDGETHAECSNRKRRSASTTAACEEGQVLTPSGCKFRCKDDYEKNCVKSGTLF